jgi:hypothetical protein
MWQQAVARRCSTSRRKQGQPNELCNQGSLSGNQAQSVSISHRWQAVACRGNLTSYAFRPTQWESGTIRANHSSQWRKQGQAESSTGSEKHGTCADGQRGSDGGAPASW